MEGMAVHAPHHTTCCPPRAARSRASLSATLHCLTGCAIGEIVGMIVATALGLSNFATVALSIVLAFVFGYG